VHVLIIGDQLRVYSLENADAVIKLVRTGMSMGLVNIGIEFNPMGWVVSLRGSGEVSSLIAMLAICAEAEGTTPEALFEQWRAGIALESDK
jgi:hypothetical protein